MQSFTLAGGGAYDFELNSVVINPGVNQDFLNITNALSITAGSANPFVLRIVSLNPNNGAGAVSNFASNVPYTFTLATAGSISGFDAGKIAIDTSSFLNPLNGGRFELALSSNAKDLLLTFVPVPEPASLDLLALGALPLISRRRYRTCRLYAGRTWMPQPAR